MADKEYTPSTSLMLVELPMLVASRSPETPLRTIDTSGWRAQCKALSGEGTRLLIGGCRFVRMEQWMDEDGDVDDETLRPEGVLELWDVERGVAVRRFDGVGHDVRACALSPDGRLALTGAEDEPLRLWDIESGSCLVTYGGLRYGCYAGAVADDGAIVAVTPGEAHVLSSEGTVLQVTALPFDSAAGYGLSPDGHFFIGCTMSGGPPTVVVWDVFTGKQMMVGAIEGTTQRPPACALSRGGRLALILRQQLIARRAAITTVPEVWDVATGRCVATLHGATGFPRGCALSPEGERALIAADDGVRLWDVVTGEVVRMFYPSRGRQAAWCIFARDGRRVAASSYKDTIDLWSVAEDLSAPEQHVGSVTVWAVRADGTSALSGSEDHTLRLWDLARGQTIRTFVGHASSVSDCAIHPSGISCVSASLDATLREWDLATGTCRRELTDHSGPIRACTFSADGRHLFSLGMDGNLFLWDWEGGEVIRSYASNEMRSLYFAMALAPDGRSVAASTIWHIYVWPVERVRPRLELEVSEAYALVFSPDSRFLVAGDDKGHVLVWDAATGERIHALDADASETRTVCFSPDGRILASAHRDGALCLWDVAGGALRGRWSAPSSLASCRFSDDGLRLYVGDAEGNLHHLEVRAAGA